MFGGLYRESWLSGAVQGCAGWDCAGWGCAVTIVCTMHGAHLPACLQMHSVHAATAFGCPLPACLPAAHLPPGSVIRAIQNI